MRINNKSGTTTLFVAVILLVSIACIPAVSANPNKEATETVSAIETPVIESLKDIGILATYHINQGGTNYHTKPINGETRFDPYLTWIPSTKSLRLTITSPTGQVYGPWTDGSDGSVNGRIDFDYVPIQAPSGLAKGDWTSAVYCITGPADYSYTVST